MKEKILTLKSKIPLNCDICDRCCKYRGDIKLTPINVIEISKYLKIPIKEFLDKYTVEVKDEPPEIVINAIGDDRRCVFNNDKTFKCEIHKYRPIQCVMFPLYPIDINNDLFINMGACIVEQKKKTSINKWLNGNNIYKRNKKIYLKWIEFLEEIQPKWKKISEEKQIQIKNIIFENYNIEKKNYNNQILENMKKVRELIY